MNFLTKNACCIDLAPFHIKGSHLFLTVNKRSHSFITLVITFYLNFQQLSPYGNNRAGHSPGRTSPVVSPSSPQKLNNSFESNSSSSDYSNPNSVSNLEAPHIYVNDRAAITMPSQSKTTTNSLTSAKGESRQCALDNKVFAEHFNLDDLSASFRSLYKSVFTQQASTSNSSGTMNMPNSSQITAPKGLFLLINFLQLKVFIRRTKTLSEN